MRFCPLYSGSSGNCIYVGSDDTHLLVDIGVSGKKAEEGLNTIGLTGKDINGILITHEHSDHIQGLGVFSRKYGVPMYAAKTVKISLYVPISDVIRIIQANVCRIWMRF